MSVEIICGDARSALAAMPEQSVHCVVTSPPYWHQRDYGCNGQVGLEETPCAYIAALVDVFSAVYRVLRDDGTCWIVIGSSFASGTIESDDYVMRDDLTDQERGYVYAELAKHFESQSEALSPVRQADASPESTVPPVLHGAACPTDQLRGEDV